MVKRSKTTVLELAPIIMLCLVLFLYFLGELLFPEVKQSGVTDLFIKGGLIGAVLMFVFVYLEGGKQLKHTIITSTYKKTNIILLTGFLIGGFLLGLASNKMGLLTINYSVIPELTLSVEPVLGAYRYILNAPIEDALFILLPSALLNLMSSIFKIVKNPFQHSLGAFILTGTLATVPHRAARGGEMWMHNLFGAIDPSVFIVFGLLGLIAKEYGIFTADALHIGINSGVATAMTYAVVG